jgi:acyl-homoserine lactone acylase PvdQ
VAFGFAYAQVEDKFRQLEENIFEPSGRTAEIYGETALPTDILLKRKCLI